MRDKRRGISQPELDEEEAQAGQGGQRASRGGRPAAEAGSRRRGRRKGTLMEGEDGGRQ